MTYGTAGIGSALHMNMELFDRMAGVKIMPVHYRGATPALNDLIGGSINAMTVSVASALPPYQAGQIKILGIGSPKRLPQLPDIPTVAESGLPGYQATAWFGLFGPAGMPRDIVMKIDTEVIKIFNDPAFRARFLEPQMFEVDGGAAGRVRRLHQGRTRQVVQGHPRRQFEAGMIVGLLFRRRAVGGQDLAGEIERAGDEDARRRLEIELAGHRDRAFERIARERRNADTGRRSRRARPPAPSCPDGSAR